MSFALSKTEVIEEVKSYFTSSDQWRRLVSALQEPDPQNAHIHLYLRNSIHPKSLEEIVRGYFEIMGWPISRKIDWLGPDPVKMAFHGVLPEGKVNTDIFWFFDPLVGVRPAEGGEEGSNLLIWGKHYMDAYYKKFPFREVSLDDKKALGVYFNSSHWQDGLSLVVEPDTVHLHINVESSIHPDEIKRYALESLEAQGWKVDYVSPNVYHVREVIRGKLVFLCREPEKIFDIGWKFNPEVVIKPASEPWIHPEVGYDRWTKKRFLEQVMYRPFVELSSSEIQDILQTIRQQ